MTWMLQRSQIASNTYPTPIGFFLFCVTYTGVFNESIGKMDNWHLEN